jgi:diguanylate cyclase (GGDEF)-like protein
VASFDDALEAACRAWAPRFGAPLPSVARGLAREVLLVALTGCPVGPGLADCAAAVGVLRAHEGHDAASVVEDVYALRPLCGGAVGDALEVAVRAAVAAWSAERARPGTPTRDRLTGLLERPVFDEALAHEVAGAARHGAPALLVVDLDGLVGFTQRHGHLAGDLHLVRLAEVLTAASRRSDVLARLSVDQLGVLLPRTDVARATVVARRVLARTQSDARTAELATPGSTAELPRLSVGIGWLPAPRSAGEVVDSAEAALRQARSLGGWVVETPPAAQPEAVA